MIKTHLLGALPPQQYDFANWDYFQSEASRFHDLTCPDRHLVIDRIATFRSLMSPKVIAELGCLVNLHPRFQTNEGWDDWLLAVTDALRNHDYTIKDAVTAEGWTKQFKKGKIDARHLWNGLDLLASRGEISSDEQRQLFWDAHSWQKQAALLDRCPYFDPRNDVWAADATDEARLGTEQLLCRIMALSIGDDRIDLMTGGLICLSLGAAVLLVILGMTFLLVRLFGN